VTRGEVYWVNLQPRSGSEQHGRRPVIIVSHDGFNRTGSWSSIIVVPISTSARQRRRGPTAIPLPSAQSVQKGSTALCHQVTTVDRSKFGERIGLLSEEAMQAVNAGLAAALDLPSEVPGTQSIEAP